MKVGLALSGGGVRGIAHLGALKALLESGIKPSVISGVSSGAIVGALYSSGMTPEEILQLLMRTNLYKYIRPAWGKFGFLNITKLMAVYKLNLPIHTFEQLNNKLIISAADIKEGKTIYYSEGDLIKAILASSCLPVIFAPYEIDDKLMVDGGIINNLPVEPLIGNCDIIIGVHTNPSNRDFKVKSMKNMLERTFHLAVFNNVKERIKYCDIFIEPPKLVNYTLFDLSKASEIFNIGYEHTLNVLDDSHVLLEKYGITRK